MNIRCPHCQTVFRVDPARIPDRGVRARCARCSGTFRVERPASENAAAGSRPAAAPHGGTGPTRERAPADQPRPAWAAGRETAAATAERPSRLEGRTAGGASTTAFEPPRHAEPEPPRAPPAPAAPAAARARPTFGRTDPDARAQRIARALVSDIVAYHRDKVEESVQAGTLRADFREEIMKSWEEYVAQVGIERAKATPFFRDALNDILARGRKVF